MPKRPNHWTQSFAKRELSAQLLISFLNCSNGIGATMGGYFPAFVISIAGKPVALSGYDSVLKPENRPYITAIIRALIAQRQNGVQPAGEVTVRAATFDECGIYEAAIMEDDSDDKRTKLQEQAAQIVPPDWKGLDSIDWVILE